MFSQLKGYTLIEITLVLVIIALLVSIAIPSYQHFLITIRRHEATLGLITLASHLERYYIENKTYQHASWHNLNAPLHSLQGYYTFELTQLSHTSYVIQAVPESSQMNDTDCAKFIYNELGEKNISGTGRIEECW